MPKGKTIRLQEDAATGTWKITMNFAVPSEFVASVLAQGLAQPIPVIQTGIESPRAAVVRLLRVGPNKVDAINCVRQHTGWGLKDAKDSLDSPPSDFPASDPLAAQFFCNDLNACGATAVVE